MVASTAVDCRVATSSNKPLPPYADRPELDDADWHVFTGSQYDPNTGEWNVSKVPVHHIV